MWGHGDVWQWVLAALGAVGFWALVVLLVVGFVRGTWAERHNAGRGHPTWRHPRMF